MRTTPLLAAPLFALLLTGCGPADHAPAEVAAEAPAPGQATAPTGDCSPLGPPTVVRYHSRLESATQHSVHLLNSGSEAAATAGCDPDLPLASSVVLSYRVAGG